MFIWYFLRKKKFISHTAEKKKQNLFTLGENVDKVNNKHTNEQTLIFQGNFHGTNNSSKLKKRGEEEFLSNILKYIFTYIFICYKIKTTFG